MGLDTWVGVCFALLVLSGGIIARVKSDYFSRGAVITLLTNIFGLIALIISHPSRARINDEQDIHRWPHTAHLAVFIEMILVLILLLRYWLS